MNLPPRLARFVDWLEQLGRNLYFWSGIAVLLVVSGVVYVTFDAYMMPSYTRHDVSVVVPNVEGTPVEEARQTLTGKGLQVQSQPGRFNPNVPRGEVVDQSPPGSSGVKPGRRVYLTINEGEVPSVRIPDLTGTSLREARNRISSLGLEVGNVRADSIPSPYPQTVTRQSPEPGDSLDQGRAVNLWYSTGLGEDRVRVPALVGLSIERARQTLLRQNLRAVVIRPDAEDAEPGTNPSEADTTARQFVREQSVRPGSRLQAGKEVRLYTTPDSTRARDRRSQLPDSLRGRAPGADSRAPSPDTTENESGRIGF
jgi:beta-lactam-binding protein with PASTA domain